MLNGRSGVCRVEAVCAGSVPGVSSDPAQRIRWSETIKISLCQVCRVMPNYDSTERIEGAKRVRTTMATDPAHPAQTARPTAAILALSCGNTPVLGLCRVAGTPGTHPAQVTGGVR